MRRAVVIPVVISVVGAAAALAFFQATTSAPRPLAELVPSGPLIYLEATQFSQLLGDWNNSPEKKAWLASTDAEVFNRSNLMIKLGGVYKEYAEAAGFSPDMAAIQTMSGDASALGLYDFREVEFVYITRLPADRALGSAIGKRQDRFEKREAAGFPFYISRNVSGPKRTVAFAVADGYLVLGTREDLVANCLSLIAKRSKDAVSADPWFAQAVSKTKSSGELRMVMNLEALVKSTYFRSYWVQRNVPDVKPFWTGVADIHRSPEMIREDRVLLRAQSTEETTAAAEGAVAELARLAPDTSGLYQIWAGPSAAKVTADLEQQVLSPQTVANMASRFAPATPDSGIAAGSESDLEIRIDEPPLPAGAGGEFTAGPIEKLIQANPPLAMLETRYARAAADPLFLKTPGAIAILGGSDWDRTAVRSAISMALESIFTTSGLGVQWHTEQAFDQMDGLAQVTLAVRGKLLIIATDAASLTALLDRMPTQPVASSGATYLAGVSIARERAPYLAMMSALDFTSTHFTSTESEGRDPAFFSANVGSLLSSLGRLTAIGVTARDRGSAVEETVEYRLR
jgi:hypothetical protein